MTKSEFKCRIIISSLLSIIAIVLILAFCCLLFIQYTKPNEKNTSVSSGTAIDVYHGGRHKGVIVEMSNGDQFQLVYPHFSGELYSTIGYDLEELCELLEGENIEYRRMNRLPWIVEIYVDDTVIDNNILTAKQIVVSRVTIIILGTIMLSFPIAGEVAYIKSKYRLYKKAGKKRARKARESLKKTS